MEGIGGRGFARGEPPGPGGAGGIAMDPPDGILRMDPPLEAVTGEVRTGDLCVLAVPMACLVDDEGEPLESSSELSGLAMNKPGATPRLRAP
jgi:hypothetical protein